jgi:hypothetical protein
MVGIIEEQHAERARLFMQWHQMDWPILVDTFNLLDVNAVPITATIDEHGTIQHIGPQVETIETEFVDQTYPRPDAPPIQETIPPDLAQLQATAQAQDSAAAWNTYATRLAMWTGPQRLDEAIQAVQRALALAPGDGPTHFYAGTLYRLRFDSAYRQPQDFQQAVHHWEAALATDPNRYIWRRRIQQYGPRLDKPYPFYDWIHTARQEIHARGETPVALPVEPRGSEFASRVESFETSDVQRESPDPEGRIHRDNEEFVEVETTLVPPHVSPGAAIRCHILFRPNPEREAHWNNEVDDLVVWVDPPEGWHVDQRYLTTPNPEAVVSEEIRGIEFEVQCPEDAAPGEVRLSAYALYYVCEDIDGVCMYRRQDIQLPISVKETTAMRTPGRFG